MSEEQQELFDALVGQAQQGEKLDDPRCGKHEDAVCTGVDIEQGDASERLLVHWSNMTDKDGNLFTFDDRVFLPQEDAHPVTKIRFMQKLKALGVIPMTYKSVLYFTTPDSVEALRESLEKRCVGQSFPLTITMDQRGFYNCTVRAKKKESAPF